MDINFKTKEHPEAKTVQWDLPSLAEDGSADEALQALVDRFGAESVFENARANYIIGVQAFARRHIEKDVSEIQSLVDGYNPNERSAVSKLSPQERAIKALQGMSDEERAELFARFG